MSVPSPFNASGPVARWSRPIRQWKSVVVAKSPNLTLVKSVVPVFCSVEEKAWISVPSLLRVIWYR